MNERSRTLKKRPYSPERELDSRFAPSGRAVSARYHDASLHQETEPHVSVWDRLGRASSECVLDTESRTLSKFGIQTRETKVHQQHGPVFPAAYSEQHSEIFQREVLAVPVTGTEFPNSIKIGNPRVKLSHPLNRILHITSAERDVMAWSAPIQESLAMFPNISKLNKILKSQACSPISQQSKIFFQK